MKYNPQLHHRRSIRLKGYDYSQAGAYFITICCNDRLCRFGKIGVSNAGIPSALPGFTIDPNAVMPYTGEINTNQMHLNEWGIIAYNEWIKLPDRFPAMDLDVFQIMPNHMHAIVLLNEQAKIPAAKVTNPPFADNTEPGAQIKNSVTMLGNIIGAYKSLVTNEILKLVKLKQPDIWLGKIWHRNYYEHIIRNEKAYQNIATYIINNPANWANDKFFQA